MVSVNTEAVHNSFDPESFSNEAKALNHMLKFPVSNMKQVQDIPCFQLDFNNYLRHMETGEPHL